MTNSQQLASNYADTMYDTLTELWQAIDDNGEYDGQDATDYLDELPLEIITRVGAPFTVVLTTGGPHAEITATLDDDGAIRGTPTLDVYWSSGEASHPGHGADDAIRRTAEHFSSYLG